MFFAFITKIPNLITRYEIKDSGEIVHTLNLERQPTLDQLTFLHTELLPYSQHHYDVTACTSDGCATSDDVTVVTSQSEPEGVSLDSLVLNTTHIELFWEIPEMANGEITEYRIFRRFLPEDGSEVKSNDYVS